MYRLLASLCLIVAMVVTMDRVLASSLGSLLLRSDDRFISIYRPDPPDTAQSRPAARPADVVVLGNSRADNHFPAAEVEKATCGKALNLGMGGAPTVISDLLWQDYVERHGAPRLLILEPTGVVDDPHMLADLPLFGYYSPRVDAYLRQEQPQLWASDHAFNLLAFNSNQTIRLALGLLRPADDRTLSGTIPTSLKAQISRLPMEKMEGFEANWRALDRIIATARSHGTRVAVVVTPFYPGYVARVSNFDEFFTKLKQRLPQDVAVIDARHAVAEETSFMDALHVNQQGVRTMFATIEPDLQAQGTCPVDAVAQLSGLMGTARH